MTRVLIAGVSTRAAAASAARAGFRVTAIDGYGDRDQHAAVRALSLRRDVGLPFSAAAAADAATSFDCEAVVYLSSFENHPAAVSRLSAGRQLWGNPPAVLRRARDPFEIAAVFRSHDIATPHVLNDSNASNASNDWLLKPLSSGGGHGIRRWRAERPVPRGSYIQQRIDGTPGSVVFVAADGRSAILGVSRQLIGDARFGAHGYRYCGSILAPAGDPQFADGVIAAYELAHIAAAEFALLGVNGIDFIATDNGVVPLEINPRWSSSMELVERASNVGVFAAHAAACASGALRPSVEPPTRAVGKALVFARCPCVIGDTDGWLRDSQVGDVPYAGEFFDTGEPVCTVFADADDAKSCEAELVRRAERIYADLKPRTPATSRSGRGIPLAVHE